MVIFDINLENTRIAFKLFYGDCTVTLFLKEKEYEQLKKEITNFERGKKLWEKL